MKLVAQPQNIGVLVKTVDIGMLVKADLISVGDVLLSVDGQVCEDPGSTMKYLKETDARQLSIVVMQMASKQALDIVDVAPPRAASAFTIELPIGDPIVEPSRAREMLGLPPNFNEQAESHKAQGQTSRGRQTWAYERMSFQESDGAAGMSLGFTVGGLEQNVVITGTLEEDGSASGWVNMSVLLNGKIIFACRERRASDESENTGLSLTEGSFNQVAEALVKVSAIERCHPDSLKAALPVLLPDAAKLDMDDSFGA